MNIPENVADVNAFPIRNDVMVLHNFRRYLYNIIKNKKSL